MSTVHFFCVLCGAALQTTSDSRYDLIKCPSCTRHVPVPRPAHGLGNLALYPPVFPPEVLELSVKFQCTACGSVLRADARCEGREMACPDCEGTIAIPHWSNLPARPLRSEAGKRVARPATAFTAPTLSVEEIDFLRGTESGKPEAAA